MTLSAFDVKISFRPALCCRMDAFLEPALHKFEYYQRKNVGQWLYSFWKYRLRFMRIFAGVAPRAGASFHVKRHRGLSTTAILAI